MSTIINKPTVSIVIILKLDSIDRLENVLAVTDHLSGISNSRIILAEIDSRENNIISKHIKQPLNYNFFYNSDPILFRTFYINKIAGKTKTRIIGIWDTDVICPIEQLNKAIEILQNNEADFVYPYDKYFLDTSPILRQLYLKTRDFNFLLKNMKKMKEMYPPNPLGGAFLANMKAYRESGFENENFYGWGLEDGERYHRWEKLGYRIKRVSGPLFHLSHGRGINSTFHDSDQNINKRRELMNVVRARVTENKTLI